MKAIVTNAKPVGDTIHKFETAGLGKAPFVFVSSETRRPTADCPNPSTSCDYCGTGIINVFWIRSADGQQSKVGCECIRKTGDAGLLKIVSQHEADKRRETNAKRRAARNAKELADIAKAEAMIDTDSALVAKLDSQPHPADHLARDGKTMLNYVCWLFANGYKAKAAAIILNA